MLKNSDKKINKLRSGRVPSAGVSVFMEWDASPSRYVDVFTHLGAHHTVGVLWKLPHVDMISY